MMEDEWDDTIETHVQQHDSNALLLGQIWGKRISTIQWTGVLIGIDSIPKKPGSFNNRSADAQRRAVD